MGRFSFPSSIPNLDRCWRSLLEAWIPFVQTEIRSCRCRGQAETLGLRVEDCKAESGRCDVIRGDWKKFGKFEDSKSTSNVGLRQDRVVSIGGEALPAVSDASFQEVGLLVLVRPRRSKSFPMTGEFTSAEWEMCHVQELKKKLSTMPRPVMGLDGLDGLDLGNFLPANWLPYQVLHVPRLTWPSCEFRLKRVKKIKKRKQRKQIPRRNSPRSGSLRSGLELKLVWLTAMIKSFSLGRTVSEQQHLWPVL